MVIGDGMWQTVRFVLCVLHSILLLILNRVLILLLVSSNKYRNMFLFVLRLSTCEVESR